MSTELLPISELLPSSIPFSSYLPGHLKLDGSNLTSILNGIKFRNHQHQYDGHNELEVHRLELVFDSGNNPFRIGMPGFDGFEIRLNLIPVSSLPEPYFQELKIHF